MAKTHKRYFNPKKIDAIEYALIDHIDFENICGQEAKELIKLLKHKDFSGDRKLQDKAALIFRGIDMKMTALRAGVELGEKKDFKHFLEAISKLRQEYSLIYNRIPIDVTTDGRPLVIEIERQGELREAPHTNEKG